VLASILLALNPAFRTVYSAATYFAMQSKMDCAPNRNLAKRSSRRNMIFCGNPGAGKSTLLNSLMGKVIFNSGIAIGKGMTFRFDCKECEDGNNYMDTPGLSDLSLRKQAADAIAQALRSGGWYRLFFVVTLESGRFKPDDLTTIRLVLGASKDIKDYGLILNKVSKKVAKQLNDPSEMNALLDLVFSDPNIPRTTRVFVNLSNPDLEDENDMYVPAPVELKKFVQSVEDSFVRAEKVEDLKINEFEELQEQAAAAQNELLHKKQELSEQKQKLEEKKREVENMEQQMSKERSAAEAKLKEERARAEKQLQAQQQIAKNNLEAEKKAAADKIAAEKASAANAAAAKAEAEKQLQEEKQNLERLEKAEEERQAELEKQREELQRERDAKASLEAAQKINEKIAKHGFYMGCWIKAVGSVVWMSNGEKLADDGHGGIIKGHACDEGEDDDGKARAHVDWDNGQSSRHPYSALTRWPGY